MNKNQITALIITKNEANNIGRCLDSLTWLSSILVIDSFSDDQTLPIISKYSNTRIIQREFDSFAEQCNFGLTKIETKWVLSLDADYVLPKQLEKEISMLSEALVYYTNFIYCINGQAIKSRYTPKRPILFPKEFCSYYNEGHAHRLHYKLDSKILENKIRHDDRKSFTVWFKNQINYANLESLHLMEHNFSELRWSGRIRKIPLLSIPLIFLYVFIFKGAVCELWHGWVYTFQRVLAEFLINYYYLRLVLRKLTKTEG